MDAKKIVVVGGVAGGMSFATRYRRLNQSAEIIVLDKGPYVSFANCGLPYYISKEITNRSDLLVADQKMLENRFRLNVKTNHEVIKINPTAKTLDVRNKGRIETMGYDQLILSTGAKPIVLGISGRNEGVFTLRNIPDVDAITNYIENHNPKSAVVIGAGFIGLEMAENLRKLGLGVSVVEKAPQVLPPFDVEMAQFAFNELIKNKVSVYTNTSVTHFEDKLAVLEDGTKLNADMVIMSVGVLPDTQIAEDAGLVLGMRGGLVVNENYQTSDPNIYAIGDAIIVNHTITHEKTMIPLASPANRQGRQLADILNGIEHANHGSLGTAILRLFDLTFASTGLNERQLQNKNYEVLHLYANNHAGYFPNATKINLKVIFDPKTEAILGAQAVGKSGVDKRIDVIATAIKAKMKVSDLQELELSYAPPYGSAKDIVNMVGYVSQNMIMGITKTVQWHALDKLQEAGALILDVREENEVKAGAIKGSLHMKVDDIYKNMNQLPKDRHIVIHCESGGRSYNAEQILRAHGFEVSNLDGGYHLYKVFETGSR